MRWPPWRSAVGRRDVRGGHIGPGYGGHRGKVEFMTDTLDFAGIAELVVDDLLAAARAQDARGIDAALTDLGAALLE